MRIYYIRFSISSFIICGLTVLSFSQSHKVNDTLLLSNYCQKGRDYFEMQRDSGLYFCEKAIAKARTLNQPYYIAYLLVTKAFINMELGHYPDAWRDLHEADVLAADKDIGKNILKTTYSIQHFPQEDPSINRDILLGYIRNNWGILHGFTRDVEKEFSEYMEAKRLVEPHPVDKFLLAGIYVNISQAFVRANQLDSAVFYQNLALKTQIGDENDVYTGSNIAVLGELYLQKGDLTQARDSLLRGIDLILKQKEVNKIGLAQTYNSLGNYYLEVGKIDSALHYVKKSYNHFKSINSPFELASTEGLLSFIYSLQNRYDSAYFYLNHSKQINDSLKELEIERLSKFQNMGFENELRVKELENERILSRNKNRVYFLILGLALLLLTSILLYYFNRRRRQTNRNLKNALNELKSTQAQLIQKEKLASLGELTAGIAHEIQNPLNFVNNFSELSIGISQDLKEEVEKPDQDKEYIDDLLKDLTQNQEKINHHGKRASGIVRAMLEHSRASTGERILTDINALCDEYLRLAYHGMRAKDKSFNADFRTEFQENLPKINIIPQDIGRVLLNLINNAFYAVHQKAKTEKDYTPSVSVSTKQLNNIIEIRVKDNGTGIPDNIKTKIFQPFFTTKPTGEGTGLGLSLSYDIVTKGHGGTLEVVSTEGVGCTFIIKISLK